MRRARALLAIGAVTVAAYVVVPLTSVVIVQRNGSLSSRDVAAIVVGAVVVLAAVGALIAIAARRGAPRRRVVAWSGTRAATADGAPVLAPVLGRSPSRAGCPRLLCGSPKTTRRTWFVLGRASAPSIGLTCGALAPPPKGLAALCAHELTALTSRRTPSASPRSISCCSRNGARACCGWCPFSCS